MSGNGDYAHNEYNVERVEEGVTKATSSSKDSGRPSSETRSTKTSLSNSVDDLIPRMQGAQIGQRPLKGVAPVAKSDLPYTKQGFVERPLPMVEHTTDRTFEVETNYFRVNFPEKVYIYMYNVEFTEARKRMIMKKQEFTSKAFWYAYKMTVDRKMSLFPPYKYLAYNGVNMLWSTKKLDLADQKTLKFQIDDGKEYYMSIKYTGRLVELKPNPEGVTDQMNLVTVLDEVLTARLTCLYEGISSQFHKSGKSMFYTPKDLRRRQYVVQMGGALEGWTGLHGAIKPNLQAGLLLNVDIGHSVFYKQEFHLVDFLYEITRSEPVSRQGLTEFDKDLRRSGMAIGQRKKLEAALKGHTLVYSIPNGRSKTFRFSAIGTKAASAHTFKNKETNRDTSIQEYYYHAYQVNLAFPYLPCICISKSKNNWVPMEFIYTDNVAHKFKGKIPEKQLRKLVQETAYPPDTRKEIIKGMASVSNGTEDHPVYLAEQDEYMESFGVSVDRTLLKVKGSLLPPPTLQFGEGLTYRDDEHSGVWDLKNGSTLKKIKSASLTVIPAIVFLTPQAQDQRTPYDLNPGPLGTLMEVLHNFGVNCPGGRDAFVVQKFDCYTQQWDVVCDWMREFKATISTRFGPEAVPMVLYVFPYKCTTRRQNPHEKYDYFSEYAMVKYICDVVTGIHCQGILAKTYAAMGGGIGNSTAQNVALKVLGKIGATLYTIEENPTEKCWGQLTDPKEPTLILGIDVSHAGEQDRKEGRYAAVSVAAVVGNIDISAMKYEAAVRVQAIGQERTLNIREEAYKRILAFKKSTQQWPAHIVIFRDSVSESQFQEILYEEKAAIMEAIAGVKHPDFKTPTITYIVLSKRHHTRFFPINDEDRSGKAGNLKPGSIVESAITSKTFFDFFLVSQHGPLGTSRPTHYYVLHDDWQPDSTFWQKITYYLTYGFCRCTKSISQPAPTMYAHLAAKRAKDYLNAHVNVHRTRLDKMTEYELIVNLGKNMEKHADLDGMVFV